jgi:hypothetical protein
VALDDPLPSDLNYAIGPMTDALAHRGPDGEAFCVNTHVALGHGRLTIIDREGGVEPMTNEARFAQDPQVLRDNVLRNARHSATSPTSSGPLSYNSTMRTRVDV